MTGFVKFRFMYRLAVHNSIGNFLVESVKLTKGMLSLHFATCECEHLSSFKKNDVEQQNMTEIYRVT